MAPTSSAPPTAPPDGAALFSPDYNSARQRFRDAATAAGAGLDELPLAARGPTGEPLGIDIAWLGPRPAARVLLHISGVHGVEAYAGSATQLALLDSPPPLNTDTALVLVHVLNPWGMAWLRRCNEANVDLNRNFLDDNATWSGCPPLYRCIETLLNPPSPPARDGFVLRLGLRGLRHGVAAVRQAIAHGQYRYPQGLFYGGAQLQPGPRLLAAWLREQLAATSSLFVIDMHTGLGERGTSTLITETHPGCDPASLSQRLGLPVLGDPVAPEAYAVRGSLGAALPRLLPHLHLDFVLQEIGTAPPLRVLHALREENRWHHHGAGHLDHPAKRALLAALCPPDAEWRRAAVRQGCELVHHAAKALQPA